MTQSSRVITIVAVGQFVPLILFPWTVSVSSLVFIAILVALSAWLCWALYRRKWWGRTLTIFVQGFNVIIRVITVFPNVYSADSGLDVALLITYLLSMVLSVIILTSVDRSDVQLVFES